MVPAEGRAQASTAAREPQALDGDNTDANGDSAGAGSPPFAFDNSYARLPVKFYERLAPTPVPAPSLIALNDALAEDLGLDPHALRGPSGIAVLAGNAVPEGAEPLAMAYAGHQFGNFVPQLGDGRAILLGEVIASSGARYDLQWKGSGPTPFSRMGDGRAALGPVLREYIVSEAMAALEIPTTRALAAVASGARVMREGPLPGGVLVRVASSHMRVGTFQYFAARRDDEAVRTLADYVIERHDPGLAQAHDVGPERYAALLEAVVTRQAHLVARWLGVGFIHGVMNTDNMSIAGETIDFGPCAFMDAFDPAQVFSSIDQQGRYAYANQPPIAQWNLACLAQTLLPLLAAEREAGVERAQAIIDGFWPTFEAAWLKVMRAKLGLSVPREGDMALIQRLLDTMAKAQADFTLTFAGLTRAAQEGEREGESDEIALADARLAQSEAYRAWAQTWRARIDEEGEAGRDARPGLMRAANPVVIARNHQVEAAIDAAYEGDFARFRALTEALRNPFTPPADVTLMAPPAPHEIVHETFCGT
ncbi:MAG: YdiU family protein [Pseudomonadota bacterium]